MHCSIPRMHWIWRHPQSIFRQYNHTGNQRPYVILYWQSYSNQSETVQQSSPSWRWLTSVHLTFNSHFCQKISQGWFKVTISASIRISLNYTDKKYHLWHIGHWKKALHDSRRWGQGKIFMTRFIVLYDHNALRCWSCCMETAAFGESNSNLDGHPSCWRFRMTYHCPGVALTTLKVPTGHQHPLSWQHQGNTSLTHSPPHHFSSQFQMKNYFNIVFVEDKMS